MFENVKWLLNSFPAHIISRYLSIKDSNAQFKLKISTVCRWNTRLINIWKWIVSRVFSMALKQVLCEFDAHSFYLLTNRYNHWARASESLKVSFRVTIFKSAMVSGFFWIFSVDFGCPIWWMEICGWLASISLLFAKILRFFVVKFEFCEDTTVFWTHITDTDTEPHHHKMIVLSVIKYGNVWFRKYSLPSSSIICFFSRGFNVQCDSHSANEFVVKVLPNDFARV